MWKTTAELALFLITKNILFKMYYIGAFSLTLILSFYLLDRAPKRYHRALVDVIRLEKCS